MNYYSKENLFNEINEEDTGDRAYGCGGSLLHSAADYVMKKGTADLTVPTVSTGSTAEAGSYSYEGYYTGEAE